MHKVSHLNGEACSCVSEHPPTKHDFTQEHIQRRCSDRKMEVEWDQSHFCSVAAMKRLDQRQRKGPIWLPLLGHSTSLKEVRK